MNLGKRIDKLRRIKKLSQKALCKGIISSAHLSNIKRGRYTPASDILRMLAQRLQVPEHYLIQYDKEDINLEQLLFHLKQSLAKNDKKSSKSILKLIEEQYGWIYSPRQEFFYHILHCMVMLKFHSRTEANQYYRTEVEPLYDQDEKEASSYVMESYFYLSALLAYYEGQYKRAYDHFVNQLTFAEPNQKAEIYYNIGDASLLCYKRREGIRALKKALALFKKQNDEYKQCKTLNALFIFHWEMNDLEAAEENMHEASSIAEKMTSVDLLAQIAYHFGLLYKSKGLIKQARESFIRALSLMTSTKHKDIVKVYFRLIELCLDEKNYIMANDYLQKLTSYRLLPEELHQKLVLEAKIALVYGDEERFIQLMTVSTDYFYDQKLWRQVECFAQELANYFFEHRRYKQASEYFMKVVEALQHQKA